MNTEADLHKAAVAVLLAWGRFVLAPEGNEGERHWATLSAAMRALTDVCALELESRP